MAASKMVLVKFLLKREHGHLPVSERSLSGANNSQSIAEEKSTIPVINKACELSGHSRSTFLVSFSPDRTKIASTHGDHTVRVTEMKTGKCTHILRGHPRTPWSIAFHPSSNEILATGCLGGEVRIWDLRGGGSEIWKSEQGRVIASLAFHPTDQVLVIATNNELLFWDWSKPEPFARSKTASDYEKVRWCKFDPFGHYLYTGIANKSTIQSDELDNIGMVDLGSENVEDRQMMRNNYRHVLDEIIRQQRDRTSTNSDAVMSEIDLVEPQSPTRLDSLRDARQYAEHVTRANIHLRQVQLDNARQYVASVSRTPNNNNSNPVPRIEIGRVEGPSAPDINDTDDHMQQIHRIPNVYASSRSSSSQGLETLAQAAAAVSQMDSTYSSPPLLSGAPRTRDINGNQLSFTQPRLNVVVSTSHQSNANRNITSTSQSSISSDQSVFQRMMSELSRLSNLSRSATRVTSLLSSNSEDQGQSQENRTELLSNGAAIGPYELSNSSSTESAESQDSSVTLQQENGEPNLVRPTPHLASERVYPDSVPSSSEETNGNRINTSNNMWQSFEGGSLNIEIPNMTPNSDDSNSLSGPLRTPRNSTDVDRPPQLPGVQTLQFEGIGRTNLLATSANEARNRITDPVGSSLYSQQRSLARSGNLLFTSGSASSNAASLFDGSRSANSSPLLSGDTTPVIPTVTTSIPLSARSPSISRLSTSPSVLTSTARAGSPGMRLDLNGVRYGRRFHPPHTNSNTATSEATPSAQRGRNLLRLLETPFTTSRTAVTNSVLSSVPQPVPPVTQTPLFQGRNRDLRSTLSRSSDHNYFATTTIPTPSSISDLRFYGHTSTDACPSDCQICGTNGGPFLPSYSSSRMRRRHLSRTEYSPLTNTTTTAPATQVSNVTVNSTTNISSPSVGSNSSMPSASVSPSRQPQRLATIIESEVREAINRIQSRRLNISETIRDLNHLQRNLADIPVNEAEGASSSDISEVPTGSTQRLDEPDIDNTENEVIVNLNEGASADDSNQPTLSPSAEGPTEIQLENIGSYDNGSSSDQSNDGIQETAGLFRISSSISNDLDERIERLDQRVSDIQRRLRERMQAMSHSHRTPPISRPQVMTQRLTERRQRMHQHLEDLQRRNQDRDRRMRRYSAIRDRIRGVPEGQLNQESTQGPRHLRSLHNEIRNVRLELARRRERERRHWHTLHRRHLHPDYSHSILDETVNQENDFQAAINRTIAGAFMANGESSIASNIVNLTHRVQRWDFSNGQIPEISDPTVNVVIPCCKLHNDATAEISQDGKLLAMFVPSHRGFPDDTVLGVFSLESHNLGKCLYTKSFGPNAISVSISPLNNYVLVGLAAKRLQWVFAPKQMVAQIYKLKQPEAGEDSMEHICDLMHPCDLDLRVHVSVNSARWLPGIGEGVVYCTNRGDLHICKPGWEKNSAPSSSDHPEDRQQSYTRQLVMQLLRINSPRTNNSATQTTTQGVRRSASTQTDQVVMSSETDSE